jgi:hypothetical protein
MADRWKWAAPVLRSVTPFTGALVGGVALITVILSLVFSEIQFG